MISHLSFHARNPEDFTSDQIRTFKGLYFTANILFIVAFISQQFSTQQGPSDEELEPESDDDGIDTESEDSEGDDGLEEGSTYQA